jgi:hypothetical protein
MNKILLTLSALCLQSSLVFASTPAELVEGIDNAREGDLATKVTAFYDQSSKAASCDVNQKASTVAYKISSDSMHEDKKPGTKTNYHADYMVLKFCFYGSTFAGAYRQPVDAVIISAARNGVEDAKGVIAPSMADKIEIVKSVDLTSIQSGQNQ